MNKISKFIPLIFLILFTIIIFRPFWQENKLPIPADTIVGLYHPWRDLFSTTNPNGLPFKNFLITDPVRQQYVWRELAIKNEKSGQMPGWNPFSLSGTPLLGNLQSASFYPLNILYLLGDFSTIWSIQVVLQVVLGGLFMFLYLKNLKLHPLAQSLGILSWVGSGFFVAWLEWNVLVQVAIWLPLLLFCVDKIFSPSKKIIWSTVFVFGLCSCFLAGHLQIFSYVLLVTSAYILLRLMETKRWKILIVFILSAGASVLLTAWQWVPVVDLFKYGVRSIDYRDWLNPGWFLPWQNLAQFIAPDFFGNPSTLNYFGVWNYGEMIGYVGVMALIFSFFSLFIVKKNKLVAFFALLILLCFLFALPTPFAKLPFQFHLPLLSSAQPTRLLVMIDFSIAVLGAIGLDSFLKDQANKKKILIPTLLCGSLVLTLFLIANKNGSTISLHNLILPSAVFGLTGILLTFSLVKIKSIKLLSELAIVIILFITVFDLSRLSTKFESFSERKYLFPQTKAIDFLQKQQKKSSFPFRIASTDDRIMPPNFATHYGLEDISGYDSIFPARYAELIVAFQRNRPDPSKPFGLNRMIVPKDQDLLYKILGVKYYLSFKDLDSRYYKLVFEEGKTKIFQSQQTLDRLYFVEFVQSVPNKQTALNELFSSSFFPSTVAVVEQYPTPGRSRVASITTNNNPRINLKKYSPNEVVATTQNDQRGFLVLNDNYYPNWRAQIDGQETKIYLTNYTFRGIMVPQGKHSVRFFYD